MTTSGRRRWGVRPGRRAGRRRDSGSGGRSGPRTPRWRRWWPRRHRGARARASAASKHQSAASAERGIVQRVAGGACSTGRAPARWPSVAHSGGERDRRASATVTATATGHHASGSASIMRSSSQPAGPDRREQRGDVVGEVVERRPAELVTVDDPLLERLRGDAPRRCACRRRAPSSPARRARSAPSRDARRGRRRDDGPTRCGRDRWRATPRHVWSGTRTGDRRASNGELAKQAVSTGPRSCARCQRVVDLVGSADVDVHLDRRGVAHHRAAGRPRTVSKYSSIAV